MFKHTTGDSCLSLSQIYLPSTQYVFPTNPSASICAVCIPYTTKLQVTCRSQKKNVQQPYCLCHIPIPRQASQHHVVTGVGARSHQCNDPGSDPAPLLGAFQSGNAGHGGIPGRHNGPVAVQSLVTKAGTNEASLLPACLPQATTRRIITDRRQNQLTHQAACALPRHSSRFTPRLFGHFPLGSWTRHPWRKGHPSIPTSKCQGEKPHRLHATSRVTNIPQAAGTHNANSPRKPREERGKKNSTQWVCAHQCPL